MDALTQTEADALLALEKHRLDDARHSYPGYGIQLRLPLRSADGREVFSFDITRGRIVLAKVSHQHRGRTVVVLARLDVGGSPHRNPDGEEMVGPHLHLYREGYDDKWAYPVPSDRFPDLADPWRTLDDFLAFGNVTVAPIIERDLLA